MKRLKTIKFVAAGFVGVILLIAIWKASSPYRIKRQFETQLLAQLKTNPQINGATIGKFTNVRVADLRYEPRLNLYSVRYEALYARTFGGEGMGTGFCDLRERNYDGYQGQCSVDLASDTPLAESRFFEITIRP